MAQQLIAECPTLKACLELDHSSAVVSSVPMYFTFERKKNFVEMTILNIPELSNSLTNN